MKNNTALIPYNEKHFRIGTKVCNKGSGSIGIVQPNFRPPTTYGRDLPQEEIVPVIWEGKYEGRICAVFAIHLTDDFTQSFSDDLQASVNSPDWY